MTGEWAYSAEYDRPQEVLSLYRRHATELMPAEWVRRRMHRFYFQCAIAVMVLSVLPGLAATVANSAYKFGFGLTHNLDVGKSLYPEAPRTAAAQVQGDTIWPFLVAALFFAAVVMPVAVRRRRRKLRGTRLSERIVVHDGKHGTPTRLLAVWERAVELRRDINVADFLTMAPRLTDTQAEGLWVMAEGITAQADGSVIRGGS
jgi:hypothetical protein